VLDFGLARWLTVKSSSKRLRAVSAAEMEGEIGIADEANNVWFQVGDSSAAVLHRTRDAAAGKHFRRTEAGVTMGTPLYMSPEQARGEELTVASDMYSYGLVLQFLFTAADPHPAGLSAREVILRAARGEKVAADGVPGDVAALITRLSQFAPADRPTAIETTARLRFLLERPRRLARRAAIAAAALLVIFASWRYASDLARERTSAIAARAEAEAGRAQAEGLIEYMLGDLRTKLDSVGRLDILDAVGERALGYVNSLDPATLSASDLARNAKALNHLGEVRQAQGKDASKLFERSLQLAAEALRREPRNRDALLVHGAAQFWIGNALRMQGKNDEALPHMREYMKDGDVLSEIEPENDKYQLERAYGHTAVAQVLEAKGQIQEALGRYETSLRIKSRIAESKAGDDDAQAEVARAINKVGVVQFKLDQFHDARQNSEREVAIYRTILARQPKQSQWKNRLANALAYLAYVCRATGDPQRAISLWEEELGIERSLAAYDPTNVDWQRNVAVTLRRIADAKSSNDAGVLALYSESHARMASLIPLAPARTSLRVDQWGIEIEYARALARFKERPRAVSLLRDVLKQSETAAMNDRVHTLRARAAFSLGEALLPADRPAAEQAWRIAETEVASVKTPVTDPVDLDLSFRVFLRRGRAGEAKEILARIKSTGYSSAELEQWCRENGC